jgi:hypothetical protein
MEISVRKHKPNSYKPMRGDIIAFICPIHNKYIRGKRCPKCEEEKNLRVDGPAVHVFKPMVYTDICETPLLIESKKQLREECRKHDVIACRLL